MPFLLTRTPGSPSSCSSSCSAAWGRLAEHPLEEGKHAAESGLDLKAYAEQAGKAYQALWDKVKAWDVFGSVRDVPNGLPDEWMHYRYIHAAPQWLWPALERAMVADGCRRLAEHPLEEGKHAAESGLDLKTYAEAAKKVYTTLSTKTKAWRVLSVTDIGNTDAKHRWSQLAELHAAPQWLWPALERVMVADDCRRLAERARG